MPARQKQQRYPELGAIRCKTFECRQSRYAPIVPSLPLRACAFGPSGVGGSRTCWSTCASVYRDCFSRIYVFSPSVNIDHVWDPVKAYCEQELHVDLAREPCFFHTYDAAALEDAVSRQFKVADTMKRQGKFVYSDLGHFDVDDFADEKSLPQAREIIASAVYPVGVIQLHLDHRELSKDNGGRADSSGELLVALRVQAAQHAGLRLLHR